MEQQGPVLVTGANSGIGWQLTLRLLKEGWEVIALVRSEMGQAPEIQDALAQHRLRVYRADLGDPTSLRAGLQEVLERERRIEVLFNNAGVAPPALALGPRGYDLAFEVNTLAPYLTTKALVPLLEAGTRKTVVQTSSAAMAFVRSFSRELLLHPPKFAPFSGPYGRSKLALSLWTQAWAPALASRGIRMVSVDPGPNHSVMNNPWRKGDKPSLIRWVQRVINRPPHYGADRLHRAAFGTAPPGAFLLKDRPTKVPFGRQADDVLAWVEELAGR